jgi:hypothetical protein
MATKAQCGVSRNGALARQNGSDAICRHPQRQGEGVSRQAERLQEIMPKHRTRMYGRQNVIRWSKINEPGIKVVARDQLSGGHVDRPLLVIVNNLRLVRPVFAPDENEAPLAVDPDRVLTSAVAA